jgi:hypothetical protein
VFLPDQLKLLVPIHLTILKIAVSRRLSVVGAGLKIIKKTRRRTVDERRMKQMRKGDNNERTILLIYVLLGLFGPNNEENCVVRFR